MHRARPLAVVLAGSLSLSALVAQQPRSGPEIPAHTRQPLALDSGYLDNAGPAAVVVHREVLSFPTTTWMQFRFGEHTNLPKGSYLRMVAKVDEATQRHDGRTLADYGSWSAAFNGDQVVVELVAGPRTRANRFTIDEVIRGLPNFGTDTICGNVDDRAQSFDPRQGRLWVGCTGWMIDEDVMLTAGHCVDSGTFLIEFNVPNSTSSGTVVRAHPDDQYPFQLLATQSGNTTIGNDFAVARVMRNSTTNQLPTDRNGGQWYSLGPVPNTIGGNDIRITGYGSTSPRDSLYLVQKTHVGPLSQIGSTSLCYSTDTTGGNSGSPIVHEQTGNAIGIHTNGGCSSTGGCNSGTRADRADLQAAIRNASITPGVFGKFGMGCLGTGVSSTTCSGFNGSGGNLTNDTRNNEYAYQGIVLSQTTVSGVRLYTQSSTGQSETLPIAIYASNGSEPADQPLATATMTVGTTPGFYQANFTPPVMLNAGVYFVAGDHSAQTTYLCSVTSGSTTNAYWRRPAGSGAWTLSALVTRPSFQLLCQGSASAGAIPAIGNVGLPEIGASFDVVLGGALGATPAVLCSGLSNTMWQGNPLPLSLASIGAPQCDVLVEPLGFSIASTDGFGLASQTIPVPNVTSLVGGSVFHQWAVLDPTANALGIVLSDGGQSTIGG